MVLMKVAMLVTEPTVRSGRKMRMITPPPLHDLVSHVYFVTVVCWTYCLQCLVYGEVHVLWDVSMSVCASASQCTLNATFMSHVYCPDMLTDDAHPHTLRVLLV